MNEYVGKICPYCKTPFKENDDIVICSACEMPHHKDCWVENQGCTVFGCMGTIKSVSGPQQNGGRTAAGNDFDIDIAPARKIYCTKCGAENNDDNNFCEKCGQTLAAQKAGSPQHTHYAHSGAGAVNPYAAQPAQTYQQPAYQQTAYQQNAYQQTAYQQPAYQQPVQTYQQPSYQQPAYQQQAYQQPVQTYQQPAYQQQAYQQTYQQQAAYQQAAYQQTYQQNAYQQQTYQQAAPAYQPNPAEENTFLGDNSAYYATRFAEMRITNRNTDWNWCAFLFGPYWFAYRKMYIFAAAYCGISLLAGLLSIIGGIISIAAWFCSGIFSNYLYMKHMEQRLQEAHRMPEPMRSQHIAKHGGTSVGAVFLFALPSLILSVLMVAAGFAIFGMYL